MSKSIGMMEGAFFVSRGELLAWLNDLLTLNYTKVEEVASGAALCQVVDSIYPGKVPMSKVNFTAKTEYDYIKNFKVLQGAFLKLGIDKHIDVERLVKGRYQDNLEFLQWMKRYYDIHASTAPYDAVSRRQAAIGGNVMPKSKSEAKPAPGARGSRASRSTAGAAARKPAAATAAKKSTASTGPQRKPLASRSANAPSSGTAPAKKATAAVDNGRVNQLEQQSAELKLTIDGLERERDFYFGKLRDIEILCQTQEESETISAIFKILYATEEDFVAADELDAAGPEPVAV